MQQDVLDGITGQRQLGEDRQGDTVLVALAGQPQHRGGIGRGITDRGVMGARGDADKPVVISRIEVHRPSILAQPGRNTPISWQNRLEKVWAPLPGGLPGREA